MQLSNLHIHKAITTTITKIDALELLNFLRILHVLTGARKNTTIQVAVIEISDSPLVHAPRPGLIKWSQSIPVVLALWLAQSLKCATDENPQAGLTEWPLIEV